MPGKNGGWKNGFCECTKEIGPCLLICCCYWPGLACVQYMALSKTKIASPSPVVGCLATFFCGCLGAAWVRQAIRKEKKLDREPYWYDCGAYATHCMCCMGVQELVEVK